MPFPSLYLPLSALLQGFGGIRSFSCHFVFPCCCCCCSCYLVDLHCCLYLLIVVDSVPSLSQFHASLPSLCHVACVLFLLFVFVHYQLNGKLFPFPLPLSHSPPARHMFYIDSYDSDLTSLLPTDLAADSDSVSDIGSYFCALSWKLNSALRLELLRLSTLLSK